MNPLAVQRAIEKDSRKVKKTGIGSVLRWVDPLGALKGTKIKLQLAFGLVHLFEALSSGNPSAHPRGLESVHLMGILWEFVLDRV